MFFIRHNCDRYTIGSRLSLFQPKFLIPSKMKYLEIYMHRAIRGKWENLHLGTHPLDSLCDLNGSTGLKGTTYISIHNGGTRLAQTSNSLKDITGTIVKGAVPGIRANIVFKLAEGQSVSYTGEIPLFPNRASCASIMPTIESLDNGKGQLYVYLISLKDNASEEKKRFIY